MTKLSYSMGFSLYNKSPNYLKDIYGIFLKPFPRDFLFGKGFHEKLRLLKETEKWKYSDLLNYQNKNLKKLINHCYKNIPYYKQLFRSNNLYPSEINKVEDLKKIPILTKDIIRQNYKDMIAVNYKIFYPRDGYTSGTTGKPLKFLIDQQNSEFEYASIWRNLSWFGVDNLNSKIATFRGDFVEECGRTDKLWRYDHLTKELRFNGYLLEDKYIENMLNKLNSYQPEIIRGFPHTLYVISRYIVDNDYHVKFKPKIIFLSSENLLSHMKNIIFEAFDTKIMDRYGQAEYTVSIGTCENNSYHQNMELGIIEIINSNICNKYSGKIIGTALWNYSMPFIRYDLGDMIEIYKTEYHCGCGRELKAISKLDGRVNDLIKTKDGNYISGGAFDHFLKHRILNRFSIIPEYFHIVQEDYDNYIIEIFFKNNKYFSNNEENIMKKELLYLFGKNVILKIKKLDSMPEDKKWKIIETKIKEKIF